MKEKNLTTELSAALDTLSRAVFSQPLDRSADAKISIRPLLHRGKRIFQTERQRGAQVFHQNLEGEALLRLCADELDGRYRQALIVTEEASAQYSLRQNGLYKKTGGAAVPRPAAAQGHNREKQYLLREGEAIPALVDLGVFTPDYRIVKARYDKYRQINRFVELIDQAFAGSGQKQITILDFGCGKSYLTFILYYYFSVKRGMDVKIIGYDLKEDVVERCSAIADKYGYDGLRFVHADVSKDLLYDEKVDMVVTLHACDTATDYALHYAIGKGAQHIFSVPCCQHEINSQIRRGGELDIFLRHGIIQERMAALLTDSIRALVLEDRGYAVDMIEFTDFDSTPKNLMIRARRTGRRGTAGREQARALAERYGFTQTLLELEADE
ncbi:MAG: SAM-dependent methyltransferase [Oscillospiraceae bacterium]|nr:SAM-dependent methyltransferase [Oscillospiraceae bacterium]